MQCSVEEHDEQCPNRAAKRRMCEKHYRRWRIHGNPYVVKVPKPTKDIDPAVWFWSRVRVREPNECWTWEGAVDGKGYGQCSWKGKRAISHRVAYFLEFGEWAEYTLHSCDNPLCCNPSHLRSGTKKENTQDMVGRGRARNGASKKDLCAKGHHLTAATTRIRDGNRVCSECEVPPPQPEVPDFVAPPPGKTECIRGHPYSEENTYLRNGKRAGCRPCRAEDARLLRQRKRAT